MGERCVVVCVCFLYIGIYGFEKVEKKINKIWWICVGMCNLLVKKVKKNSSSYA